MLQMLLKELVFKIFLDGVFDIVDADFVQNPQLPI